MLEKFWVTFDIGQFSIAAKPDDGIFTEAAKSKLSHILASVKGAMFMKVKEGALGLSGNKYFLWKDWGPIAWWDIAETNDKVRFHRGVPIINFNQLIDY